MASGQRTTEPTNAETALAFVAFLAEIGLGAGAFIAGRRLDGFAGIAVGVLAVVLIVAVWGSFMSPKAKYRLPVPGRIGLGCALFVLVGAALAIETPLIGGLFALVGCTITAAAQPMLARHQGH